MIALLYNDRLSVILMISKDSCPPVWQLALVGAIACDHVCMSVCACFESSNNSRNTKARTQARAHLRAYEIHMRVCIHACRLWAYIAKIS